MTALYLVSPGEENVKSESRKKNKALKHQNFLISFLLFSYHILSDNSNLAKINSVPAAKSNTSCWNGQALCACQCCEVWQGIVLLDKPAVPKSHFLFIAVSK